MARGPWVAHPCFGPLPDEPLLILFKVDYCLPRVFALIFSAVHFWNIKFFTLVHSRLIRESEHLISAAKRKIVGKLVTLFNCC